MRELLLARLRVEAVEVSNGILKLTDLVNQCAIFESWKYQYTVSRVKLSAGSKV